MSVAAAMSFRNIKVEDGYFTRDQGTFVPYDPTDQLPSALPYYIVPARRLIFPALTWDDVDFIESLLDSMQQDGFKFLYIKGRRTFADPLEEVSTRVFAYILCPKDSPLLHP